MSLIHGLNLYTRAKKRALQYLKGKTFGYTIFIQQIVFPEKNCSTFWGVCKIFLGGKSTRPKMNEIRVIKYTVVWVEIIW